MLDQKHIIDNLHFISPNFLWAFVPVCIILILVLIANKENNKWQKLIAPHLRKYLFKQGSKNAFWMPIIAFFLGCCFITIALAGPTWKMKDIPRGKAAAALLIGLDLSHSMLADDISPNRLERAKLKINDLLKANPETDIGLFVFAGTPHIVVPFCNDYSIINHHIENLHPAMMPIKGSNINLAIQLADSLMHKKEAPSTLLLFIDNISSEDALQIEQFTKKSIHNITIIPTATSNGGSMPSFRNKNAKLKTPNGINRITKPDLNIFKQLNSNEKINVIPLTLDSSDMKSVAEEVRKNKAFTLNEKMDDEDWDNKGWFLIFPSLLIILSWFRKGWSLFWVFIGIIQLHSCSPSDKNANLWYTNNYIAQHLASEENYENAAETFESLPHKGTAYYKAGNYDAALEVFSYDSTATGHYNKGVTLMQMGRLEEAGNAFREAISLNPSMEKAKRNLSHNERMILERDSIASKMGNSISLDKKKNKEEPLQEIKAKSKDEELTSDTEADELPKDGKRVTDEQETGISKAEELERPEEIDLDDMTQKDATNIMLRKISSDPSEFLRRRFKFQVEKHYPDVREVSDI